MTYPYWTIPKGVWKNLTTEKEPTMNYSTAIFLINKNARAIRVNYDPDTKDVANFEIVKTLDQNIKVDDMVVVQSGTRHKMTTCKVIEVDVDFDLDNHKQMNWIIDVIDTTAFNEVVKLEGEAIATIKRAELRQKRDSLRDNLLKDHLDTIKALPIAAMNGDPAVINTPTAPIKPLS